MIEVLQKLKAGAQSIAELHQRIADAAIANNWPLGDSDPLGVVIDDRYYCLGDPSTDLEAQINAPVTEHQIIDADAADDFVRCDGAEYGIEL